MGPNPLTFMSGISPIGQGTGEKRAGNLNNGHLCSDSVLAARNEGRGQALPCHSLSVCLLLCELVPAALADLNKIFGGGQGWCQARLSPESAQSVKVRVRKGREI